MSIEEWAKEIAESFRDSCGERGRFEALYAIPKEFRGEGVVPVIRSQLGEVMPHAALEIRVDGLNRLSVRKHLT